VFGTAQHEAGNRAVARSSPGGDAPGAR
jgi:hypothetical protein